MRRCDSSRRSMRQDLPDADSEDEMPLSNICMPRMHRVTQVPQARCPLRCPRFLLVSRHLDCILKSTTVFLFKRRVTDMLGPGYWKHQEATSQRQMEGWCTERVLQTPILPTPWKPRDIRRTQGYSWNGGPVGELTATKSQKPSQNFVEAIFYGKRFLLTPFLHTSSI